MIPLTFLIGFYVSEVVRRYWDQYTSLPYPDRLALKLVSYVPGKVSNNFFRIPILNYYTNNRISYIINSGHLSFELAKNHYAIR